MSYIPKQYDAKGFEPDPEVFQTPLSEMSLDRLDDQFSYFATALNISLNKTETAKDRKVIDSVMGAPTGLFVARLCSLAVAVSKYHNFDISKAYEYPSELTQSFKELRASTYGSSIIFWLKSMYANRYTFECKISQNL